MTITFFSNFLNHHQLPLCKELIKQIGIDNFHFVSCECIHEERKQMGYEDMNVMYPFVIRAYESEDMMKMAIKLAHDSDVAIIGSASYVFTKIRGEENKLTFMFRERLFKNGSWHRFNPSTAYHIYKEYLKYREKNFYVLCASAYTADDLEICGFPREKCLKWGYFPELLPRVNKSFDKLRIMWCGRMLWWKHPEDAVEVGRLLKDMGVDFEMKIIGNGEKREYIVNKINALGIQSKITTYDFMSPSDIRKSMEDSNVYLFTSGKQEGWGVVLNEAMNSGCVVVANSNAGSSRYLIENEKNGFLYDGTKAQLYKSIERLLFCDKMTIGNMAYESIERTWNPRKAASNLINVIELIKQGKNTDLLFGPCSRA